jgi:hypothetical protein
MRRVLGHYFRTLLDFERDAALVHTFRKPPSVDVMLKHMHDPDWSTWPIERAASEPWQPSGVLDILSE